MPAATSGNSRERCVHGIEQGDIAWIAPGASGTVADVAEADARVRVRHAQHRAVPVVSEGARTWTQRPHARDGELETQAEPVRPAQDRILTVGLNHGCACDQLR